MILENLSYAAPLIVMLGIYMWWASWRQKAMNSVYRESQELNRQGQELVRESIRLQTESNQLMRELIEALRNAR